MLRRLPAFATLCLMAALVAARPAGAQYMFLDVDGDGAYTYADQYACADSINVDVVLVTTQTEYGFPSACAQDGSGLDINSYTINLYTGDGPIRFSNLTNRMAGMSPIAPAAVYPYALHVSYGGPLTFPPGTHRLFSFTAGFENGCASIEIVPYTCYSPPGTVTSFGSSCPGVQSDYTLRLGEDWLGALGTNIHSDPIGHWPSVTCPAEVVGVEGQPLSFPVTVNDPDCGVWSFYAYNMPPGAVMGPLSPFVAGDATGTFTWTPGPGQAGTYAVTFDASDYPNPFHGITQRDTCTTILTIRAVNSAPTANAGGPYSGVQGDPIRFDASHSTDPEGDPLEYTWTFGDGSSANGEGPFHSYAQAGLYPVVLTAIDSGGLSDVDSTTASVARDIAVRVFTSSSNDPTRLPNGKPATCFQLEPLPEAPFQPEDVVPASVMLRYVDPGCGELDVYTSPSKSRVLEDADRNGIAEYEACFPREAMQTLGLCFTRGSHTVPLEFHGRLTNGDRFRGELTHTFVVSGGNLAASISPNPLHRGSTLEFTTRKAGSVTASLFDIRGRLVATLCQRPMLEAGSHQIALTMLEGIRNRLASGVYFVRIKTEHDGSETKTVTLLR